MNKFNKWRDDYNQLTFEEQVSFHNEIESKYPDQAHFTYSNVKQALQIIDKPIVLEFGTWKADLAERAINEGLVSSWMGIEICDNAIEKTVCKRPEFTYIKPGTFRWFLGQRSYHADCIIATHFIEHLSNDDFAKLVQYCNGVKVIYFEAPLKKEGQDWKDYEGTHKLNIGWDGVKELMTEYRVEKEYPEGIIFVLK